MAITVKQLIPAKQAENSQTTQYTATGVKAVIDKFSATNTTTSTVVFSVNIVALSGSASDSNLIVDTKSIVGGETYLFPELVGQILEAGGFISTLSDTATALTIASGGREIS